jgi:hypothetical protein
MSPRLAFLVCCLATLTACNRWSDGRVAETKRRGDAICHSIEAYRARCGTLPHDLSQLQPALLREIPQPTAGDRKWEYSVIDDGSDYYLQVVGSEWGPILGRRSKPQWDYLPGDSCK